MHGQLINKYLCKKHCNSHKYIGNDVHHSAIKRERWHKWHSRRYNEKNKTRIAIWVPKQSVGQALLGLKGGAEKGTKMNTYITGLEKGGHRNLTGNRGRSPLEVVNTHVKIKYACVYKATYMAI